MSYTNRKGKKGLFKDKADIFQIQIEAYPTHLKSLADIMRSPDCYDLKKSGLLHTKFISTKPHNPNHNGCTAFVGTRVTEKRICKCMYYYGKNMGECNKCTLVSKWNNVGNIKILDCEVPTPNVVTTVGGIDLVLHDEQGKKYATEVKPPNSDESLVRMMAEAFTCIAAGGPKGYPSCSPAICFFEGSKQHKDFLSPDIQRNVDFQFLLTKVRVFCITPPKGNNGLTSFRILRII